MRRKDILTKLYEKGYLQLVDPSEGLKDAYLEKSESYQYSAGLLFENQRLEETVS